MRSPATNRPEAARRNPLPVQNNLLAVRKTHTDSGSKSSAVGPASRGGSLRDVLGPSDYRAFASFLGPALRIRQDPPRFLVPDAPAGLGPAPPRGLVVLLDRDRPIRRVRPREVGEVLAHREQLVLRVSERREERLAGAGEELDVLPGVRCLVSWEELGAAHLQLGLVVLEEAVVAVQRADAGRLARQEDDPLVAALEFDREADRSGDVLANLLDRVRVRLGPQPDGVDDAVDDFVPVGLRDFHRAD